MLASVSPCLSVSSCVGVLARNEYDLHGCGPFKEFTACVAFHSYFPLRFAC